MCCSFNEYLPYDCDIDNAISAVISNYAQNFVQPVPLNFYSVRENLNHSKEQWLGYMFKYLPRSAAEATYLCNMYLSKPAVSKMFVSSKETIRILSVMCGNGGDILGALSVIIDMLATSDLTSYPDIEVTAVDGNPDALEQLNELFKAYNEIKQSGVLKGKNCSITLKTVNFTFDNTSDESIYRSFDSLEEKLQGCIYDIITTFKGIGEIIQNYVSFSGISLRYNLFSKAFSNFAYASFLHVFASLLSQRGAVIVVDSAYLIEDRFNNKTMTNRLLAHQVFNYLKYCGTNQDMHLVYPRPCACMTEGKGKPEECLLNKERRDDSNDSCQIQERGAAQSVHNHDPECFVAMILCHGKVHCAFNEGLSDNDFSDFNFKVVGENIERKLKYVCDVM